MHILLVVRIIAGKKHKAKTWIGKSTKAEDNREEPSEAVSGFYPYFWKCARELTVGNYSFYDQKEFKYDSPAAAVIVKGKGSFHEERNP